MALKVLILGGTAEALALAGALAGDSRFEPVLSLAGRTAAPRTGGVEVRHGGFGGADGLARYLGVERIAALVDATHPFAARISANAVAAAEQAGTPRLALVRPQWSAGPGDDWRMVAGEAEAAAALPAGARAFLALGRQHLAPFAGRADVWFLVRTVDPPGEPLLPVPHETVTGRGPFALADESALLTSHRISHLVARNSGGAGSAAKLQAARDLALPVVMIERPPAPPGLVAGDVAQAVDWLTGLAP